MRFLSIYPIFILMSFSSCAQDLSNEALESRRQADAIVDALLDKETKDKNYILFSSGDERYIVVVENEDNYIEYYLISKSEKDFRLLNKKAYAKQNELLKEAFKKSIYRNDYVTFESRYFENGYEQASGNITYFVYKDQNRQRFGEARLSIIVKPNPVKAEIYLHFVSRLLENSRKHG